MLCASPHPLYNLPLGAISLLLSVLHIPTKNTWDQFLVFLFFILNLFPKWHISKSDRLHEHCIRKMWRTIFHFVYVTGNGNRLTLLWYAGIALIHKRDRVSNIFPKFHSADHFGHFNEEKQIFGLVNSVGVSFFSFLYFSCYHSGRINIASCIIKLLAERFVRHKKKFFRLLLCYLHENNCLPILSFQFQFHLTIHNSKPLIFFQSITELLCARDIGEWSFMPRFLRLQKRKDESVVGSLPFLILCLL